MFFTKSSVDGETKSRIVDNHLARSVITGHHYHHPISLLQLPSKPTSYLPNTNETNSNCITNVCPVPISLATQLDSFQQRWIKACLGRYPSSWNGFFIKRLPWNPSFVQDWIEKQLERPTIETIDLLPPLYQKWIADKTIQKVLTKSIKKWIKYTVTNKLRWNTLDYRNLLQLCFDLNLESEFGKILLYIKKTRQLQTWQQWICLYHIF
jgi:hypothetical protein